MEIGSEEIDLLQASACKKDMIVRFTVCNSNIIIKMRLPKRLREATGLQLNNSIPRWPPKLISRIMG